MQGLQDVLTNVDNWLWGNWLLFVLLGVGVLYTIMTGGIQIAKAGYIFRKTLVEPFRQRKQKQEGKGEGTISSFAALCTALASCVGSGNIVGVSTAVIAGGLGALFWMWVAAFVGMATKYGEIVLGMIYREKDKNGQYVGGPMYYIKKGLHAPWLAVLCAIFMVTQIIGGNFIQSNTISGVMEHNFSIPPLATALVLVVLLMVITFGGLKRLAGVAQKVVPFMAFLYVAGGIIIILLNLTKVPGVFVAIFQGAFGLRAVAGGAAGSMIIATEIRLMHSATRAAISGTFFSSAISGSRIINSSPPILPIISCSRNSDRRISPTLPSTSSPA